MSLDSQISDAKKNLSGAGKQAADLGNKAMDMFTDKKDVATDAAHHQMQYWKDRGQQVGKASLETVRKYPISSVIGVAGVAFLAGYFMKRRI